MLNLSILIEQGAKRHPKKPAISWDQTTITYGALHSRVNQTARMLRKLGVGFGDKVALLCPNTPDFPTAFFGILKTGATVVPLSILLKADEIAYALTDSESKAFICYSDVSTMPTGAYGQQAFEKTDSCTIFIAIGTDTDAPLIFETLLAAETTEFESYPTSPQDTAVIMYTSGTTGVPKGAELTHFNLFSNAEVSAGIVGAIPFENSLIVLPLFHIFGLTVMLLAGIRKGLHLILLARFDAKNVFRLFSSYKINIFAGVPSMYWALLKESDGHESHSLADLRIAISGGSSLPQKTIEDFEDRFHVPIIEGYGMSESSPVVIFNQLDVGRKVGSIGTPVWGASAKVVDEEGGEVPVGEKGELVFRGPSIMKGYYNRPLESEAVLKNGWLYSGDIALQDDDGFFYIVDRKKDMIIRGGMNVYPREIEELLMRHEAVAMAAVVGVPDERLGDEIKAFVVLKSGSISSEEELKNWVKDQVASYKYPRFVQTVDQLPLGASGKILKKLLKNF